MNVLDKSRSDRVVLNNIRWEQFERLLKDLGDRPSARIAYDRGTLEIMTPLSEHEYYKEIIGDLVKDLAEESNLDYESFGSTTWKQESRLAGIEPDNCFYFQNEAAIRGKLDLHLILSCLQRKYLCFGRRGDTEIETTILECNLVSTKILPQI
jgi:Uma2 family endonuclease